MEAIINLDEEYLYSKKELIEWINTLGQEKLEVIVKANKIIDHKNEKIDSLEKRIKNLAIIIEEKNKTIDNITNDYDRLLSKV
tara:strand:+ start:188 stop:436 length:249 start_codon:yes stop_codon:yes gene_type:complete